MNYYASDLIKYYILILFFGAAVYVDGPSFDALNICHGVYKLQFFNSIHFKAFCRISLATQTTKIATCTAASSCFQNK
jgi:hypothetical protein